MDLIDGISFVVGRILLAAKQKVGIKLICHLVPFQCHHSNTDCMKSSFKMHFMIPVLPLGMIFIEEIEPCQFEIQ